MMYIETPMREYEEIQLMGEYVMSMHHIHIVTQMPLN
jgi:hypothetical protein